MKKEQIMAGLNDIAYVLGVDVPVLEIKEVNFFPTPTTLAVYSQQNNERKIIVSKALLQQEPFRIAFSLAHEMRHLWQIENGVFPNSYLLPNSTDLETYNLQPHEIDANAFANLYIRCVFRRGLDLRISPTVSNAIEQRIAAIKPIYCKK